MTRQHRAALLRSTALSAAAAWGIALPARAQQPAPLAQPAGGQVTAGSASIAQTRTTTTVTQASQRAAIDWQSFNVGRDASVVFNQPGATATTLNQVTGPDPSAIAGHISANGNIILTNRSGVVFSRGAQVDAQSVIVSAAGIAQQDFMAGHMAFDQPARPGARVTNAGTITVREAGLAALVAPQVRNSGTINARLGHVVLAGAEAATLDLYGDGLVAVDVTRQVGTAPGHGHALVTNTGTITADGGTVQLTAAAADGVVQTLVDAGGSISAATVGARTGRIVIAGTGGGLVVEGTLAATGTDPGTRGGRIQVAGAGDVTLRSAALLDASGRTGGGSVAVGTTIPRAASATLPRARAGTARVIARTTSVAAGARIAADATQSGPGGRVVLLSTEQTTQAGTITARGGPSGGAGGTVDVSGQAGLSLTGGVDVSARAPGAPDGTIVLDPTNLTVVAGNAGSGSQDAATTAGSGTIAAATSDNGSNTVSTGELASLHGNIDLEATNNLTVQASFTGTGAVSLLAGNMLTINAGVSVGGTTIRLAGGPDFVAGGTSTTGGVTVNGSAIATSTLLVQADGLGITATTGTLGAPASITLAAQRGGGIALGTALVSSGTGSFAGCAFVRTATTLFDISAPGGTVTQSAGGTILAGTLASSAGLLAASLSGTANAIAQLGNATPLAVTGSLALVDAGTLTVGGSLAATGATVSLQSAALTLASPVSAASLALFTTGTVSQSPTAPLTVGTLSLAANAATLAAPGNAIATLAGARTGYGDLSVATTGSLHVTGPLAAAYVFDGCGSTAALTLRAGGNLMIDASTGGTANPVSSAGSVGLYAGTAGAGSLSVGPSVTAFNGAVTLSSRGGATALAGTIESEGAAPAIQILTDGGVSFGTAALLQAALGSLQLGPVTGGVALAVPTLPIDPGATPQTVLIGTGASLGATVGGAALAGSVTFAANPFPAGVNVDTLSLASLGAVTQAPGTSIAVGTLTGSAGSVALLGGNAIGALSDFATTGDFRLADAAGQALQLTGTVQVGLGGTLALAATEIDMGDFGEGGTSLLTTAGGGRIVLQADSLFDSNFGGTVQVSAPGGTVSIAPLTIGRPVLLGSDDGDTEDNLVLGPTLLAGIASHATSGTGSAGGTGGRVEIGSTGAVVTAGSIAINGPTTLTAIADTLGLYATGAVGESGPGPSVTGGSVGVGTLTGSAGSLVLDQGIAIATLGSLAVATQALIADNQALAVAGAVSVGGGGAVTLLAPGVSIPGSIAAPGGTVTLSPQDTAPISVDAVRTGGFSLTPADLAQVSAGTLALGQGSIASGGVSLNAPVRLAAPTLAVDAASLTETGAGSLGVGTLAGATVAGVTLSGTGNRVASLGSLTALLGDVTLTTLGDLAVTGPVQAGVLGIGRAPGTVALSAGGNLVVSATGAVTAGGAATLVAGNASPAAQLVADGPVTALTGNAQLSAPGGITLDAAVATRGSSTLLGLGTNGALSFGDAASLQALTGTLAIGPITAGTPLTIGTLPVAGVEPLAVVLGEVPGGAEAGSLLLAADPFAGAATIPQVSLLATGAVGAAPGVRVSAVGTLSAAAASLSLPGANRIAAIGIIDATGDVRLADATPLAVEGSIFTGGTIALSVPTLTLAGTASLGAPAILLAADAMTLDGTMFVQSGGVAALAPRTAGTTLTVATGAAPGLSLTPAGLARITFPGSTRGTLALGSLDGGTTIPAGAIAIDAALVPAAGTLTLYAGTTGGGSGGVTEAGGSITVGTLTGRAAGTALTGPNQVATLGAYTGTGTGGTSLTDTTDLVVTGPLADPTAVTLAARSLALAGPISAPAVTLAATAAITEAGGSITAGTLSGSAGAAVTLGGANGIGTLGSLAAGGALALTDLVPLTVAGSVSVPAGATLALADDAPVVAPTGRLAAPLGTVALAPATAGGTLTLAALSGITAGTLQLGTPASGAVAVTGALDLAGVGTVSLQSAGGVTESGAGALAVPGTLTATAGSLALGGANRIATLGAVTTTTGLAVADAQDLAVTGPLSDRTGIALASAGSLTLAGNLTAPAISLAGTTGIGIAGGILQATTLTLSSPAGITQTGGSLSAGTLTGSAATLDLGTLGPASIGTLGAFATTGPLSLLDPTGLVVAGPVTAGNGTVALGVGGDLAIAGSLAAATVRLDVLGTLSEIAGGSLSAGTLAGTAASATLGGSNAVSTLGSFSTSGALTLADTDPITVSGPVTGGALGLSAPRITLDGTVTTGTMALASTGAIVQTGGTVSATTLTGSAVGEAVFGPDDPGPTALVGTLAGFTVTPGPFDAFGGTLSVSNAMPLVVTGPLSAGVLRLTGIGRVTLAGGSIATDGSQLGGGDTNPFPLLTDSVITVIAGADGTAQLLQTGTTTLAPIRATQRSFGDSLATLRLALPDRGGTLQLSDLEGPSTTIVMQLGSGTATGQVNLGGLIVLGSGGSATLTGSVQGLSGFAAAGAAAIDPGLNAAYTINGCAVATATCGAVLEPPPPPVATAAAPTQPDLSDTTPILQDPVYALGSLAGQEAENDDQSSLDARARTRATTLLAVTVAPPPGQSTDPDVLVPNISGRDY